MFCFSFVGPKKSDEEVVAERHAAQPEPQLDRNAAAESTVAEAPAQGPLVEPDAFRVAATHANQPADPTTNLHRSPAARALLLSWIEIDENPNQVMQTRVVPNLSDSDEGPPLRLAVSPCEGSGD